jgi:hypothetical protein
MMWHSTKADVKTECIFCFLLAHLHLGAWQYLHYVNGHDQKNYSTSLRIWWL